MIIKKETIQLLRIPFSYYLMPVFFFAVSQVENISLTNALILFFILHLFIYPASNGYNSYMDNDEGSIGGLKNPPKPTKQLFYVSLLFDIIGLGLSLIISRALFLSVFVYMLASRAYSFKGIRLKRYPILGFLTVVFFQGAFTYLFVFSSTGTSEIQFNSSLQLALLTCFFLISGVYPLTQVYQHQADRASGDITISIKLGINGTFIFSSIMFAISNFILYNYFKINDLVYQFVLFQVFLTPVLVFFIFWFLRVLKDKCQASFENAMRMNFIASTCMNLFFITLLIINNIS